MYHYDSDGRCVSEETKNSPTQTILTKYEYAHRSEPVTVSVYTEEGEELTTSYEYNKDGKVTKENAPDGTVTVSFYDAMGNCIRKQVTGADGTTRTVRYEYNSFGSVSHETDARGNETYYEYDALGNLVKVTDGEGGITLYTYNRKGDRTAEVTPENYKAGAAVSSLSRLEYLYDYAGRVKAVTEVTVENGAETKNRISFCNYDMGGNLTYVLDGNQNKTTYRYTPAGKVKEILTPEAAEAGQTYALRYTYDALGRVVTEENVLGGRTTYTYDGADNVKTVTKSASGTSGTATVTYEYDGMGNVLTETTDTGLVTTYIYNTLGQMTSKTVTGAEGMEDYRETYSYDLAGRPVSVTNSMGTVIKTDYDGLGNVTERSVSDTKGGSVRTESYTYDENGNVRTYTDPENVTTTYTYDALNRVTAETVTVSGKTQTVSTEYDGNGNMTAEVDTFGNRTSYIYDAFDRLTTVVSADGIVLVSYIYDPAGNCISQTDALNKVTEYKYNGGGQVTETKDAEDNVTVQTYNALGNVAAATDGEENTTTYTYDGFGRLLTVTTADNTKTIYTYDAWGNLRTQTDGRNNKTEYTYNAANLPLTKTESGTTVAAYTYNGDGSVATMTDARGTVNAYVYNVHGDLLSETAEGTDGTESTYTYTYDKVGNLKSMTDGSGTTTYKYDALGRVTEKDAPNFGKVTYTYDLISGMEEGFHYELQNDPTGSTRTVYDRQNRVVKVTTENMEGEAETVAISYYDNGARKQVTYGDGSTEKYTYYDNNLVKGVTNTLADGTVVDQFSYTYDGAGNQTSKIDYTNGVMRGETTYTYDKQNRLESVTEPDGTVITYTYDGAGNRTTETTVENGVETVKTYSYNGRNQLLNVVQTVGGVTVTKTVYTYDANGNQLSQTETVYAEEGTVTATVLENTYDLRNQLVRSETADATIVNTYNAAGYRVGKTVTKDGTTEKTYFLYDGNSVIMEADEDGVTAKNTYGGPLLLRTEFNGAAETTYEYLYNAHGDVVTLLTDGTVVATYYYDSFGNVLEQTGDVDNTILYAGYQYDEETGLYYINARMYDPVTARFLQADTYLGSLNDPLSLNLYTYCLNNPHKYVDPTGHSVLLAFLLVTAVSFAVGAGMEYINQKYIEQRDVINYDLIFFEGAFNAVIAAVSFGTANLGVAAARQGLRLTARTATQAVGRSMAFGAMEGATESIGRQLVEGKGFSEIDYGQVAFDTAINTITAGFGGYSGAKKEAFDYARQATKSNVRSMAQMGIGVDDVVEAGTSNRRVKLNLQFFAEKEDRLLKRGVGNTNISLAEFTARNVPSVKNNEFNQFFNSLSMDELDALWSNTEIRDVLEARLRSPGGLHEWHLVSRAPQFKYWGVTVEQIKELRTAISDVNFVNPIGSHGGRGSTMAHNELLGLIDSSNDYATFTRRLNNWANYRLEGGVNSLPKGLQIK